MTKESRPASHRIGDLAEAQVAELFSSQGWIVNPVIKDYGEDLIVQICKENIMFPFHLYIQIKGTDNLRRFEHGKFISFGKLRKENIRRWLESSEPVVFIIWDVIAKSGVYEFVDEMFDEIEVAYGDNKYLTAKMLKGSIINEANMNIFSIRAVLDWSVGASREAERTVTLVKEDGIDIEYSKHKIINIGLFILIALELVVTREKNSQQRYFIEDNLLSRIVDDIVNHSKLRIKLDDKKYSRSKLRKILKDGIGLIATYEVIRECYERVGVGIEMSSLNLAANALDTMLDRAIDNVIDVLILDNGRPFPQLSSEI